MKTLYFLSLLAFCYGEFPIVINTWKFPEATQKAWSIMQKTSISAVDAVTVGCATCELTQCEHTVGFGGSPDENGETTLDAMIFDGSTMNMGAVGGLRRIKDAISVARHVLKYTQHSILVGDLATEFAKKFDYAEDSLSTNYSQNLWKSWKSNNCQPNFWTNVEPDPTKSCGPYEPITFNSINDNPSLFSSTNHDTIGMIVIDENGNIAAGTSSNGAKYKIPGRVGDAPLPGAGAYADNKVGAAVATGDGDIMMRFLPSFLAVEEMRRGRTSQQAANEAIARIAETYPKFAGALIVMDKSGDFAAACNGIPFFPYSVASRTLNGVVVKSIECSNAKDSAIKNEF